jgi:hypothetical protein
MEIKYGTGQKARLPIAFRSNDTETAFHVIDRDNHLEFLCS